MKKIYDEEKEKNSTFEDDSCFKIIALGGEAKSKVRDSMEKIKEMDFIETKKLLKEIEEIINKAKVIQQNMLVKDLRRENIVVSSVLLNHAMDILITAESELCIMRFICDLIESHHF